MSRDEIEDHEYFLKEQKRKKKVREGRWKRKMDDHLDNPLDKVSFFEVDIDDDLKLMRQNILNEIQNSLDFSDDFKNYLINQFDKVDFESEKGIEQLKELSKIAIEVDNKNLAFLFEKAKTKLVIEDSREFRMEK